MAGLVLAIIHQLSSPWDYSCDICGKEFARRSVLGRIAGWVLVLILGFAALSFVLSVVWIAVG